MLETEDLLVYHTPILTVCVLILLSHGQLAPP